MDGMYPHSPSPLSHLRILSLRYTKSVCSLLDHIASRLYFLMQLKRSGTSTGELICFIRQLVIRTVLEYACPEQHSGLTTGQSDMLESPEKRIMRILLFTVK